MFISCSLWEGFNLPVAEAQAVGTMSIAFDTGAHPEVTPFIVSDVDEAATLIAACHRDRTRLLELSRSSHQFVRSRFAWEHTAAQFSRLVETEPQSSARMYVGEGLARQLRRVRWIASDILASARARARARRNANR